LRSSHGFLGEAHYASLEYSLLFRWTPERRQLDYLRYLGVSDRPAKEVQMFGLDSNGFGQPLETPKTNANGAEPPAVIVAALQAQGYR
jgi:hypothetical protein